VAEKKNKPSSSTILATAPSFIPKKHIPRKMKHELTTINTKTKTPDVIKQVWDQLQISIHFPDFPYKLFLHLRSTSHKKTIGAFDNLKFLLLNAVKSKYLYIYNY
jgi:hypothetical protein